MVAQLCGMSCSKSVTSHSCFWNLVLSFRHLLWGDRSSVHNYLCNSFWIIFRQSQLARHLISCDEKSLPMSMRMYGKSLSTLIMCVPFFCVLVLFTGESWFTPFSSHSSWSIAMVVPISRCKLFSCLEKSVSTCSTIHNNILSLKGFEGKIVRLLLKKYW